MRNATLTAATLLALKLAWRKFFALLAIGRRAEEMATSFQLGHAVRSLLREDARRRRRRSRAGGDAAPGDLRRAGRVGAAGVRGGVPRGRPGAGPVVPGGAELAERAHPAGGRALGRERRQEHRSGRGGRGRRRSGEEARWLDRAAAAVEARLGRVEQGYLAGLDAGVRAALARARPRSVEPRPRSADRSRGRSS